MVFNADPDPAFYLNADPDPAFFFISKRIRIRIQEAKLMRIQADPDPGQTVTYVTKSLIFTCKIYLLKVPVGNVVGKKITYEGTNAFLKGKKSGLLLNFCQC